MKSILRIAFAPLCLLLTVMFSSEISAQAGNRSISVNEQNEVIQKVIKLVKDNYVFTERVPAIEKQLNEKIKSKAYANSTDLFTFLENFNKDFEAAGNDKHLDVFYGPVEVKQLIAQSTSAVQKEAKVDEEFLEFLKYENFGLRTVQRLDGNIGYFKLFRFTDINLTKDLLISAMNFVANSSALVIDLRDNGGGNANTVHFLLNYFLKDGTKIGELRYRKGNEKVDVILEPEPGVKKLLDVPLYILVNKRTSSAAEAVAYTLQAFKRATIIGEQTHGEANPGMKFPVDSALFVMIPTAVNENAITKTNWEGMGVIPDLKVSTDKALLAAQIEAMNLLATTMKSKERQQFYRWNVGELKAQLDPQEAPVRLLETAIGKYEKDRIVTNENGSLYFEAVNNVMKAKLSYMADNTFRVAGRPGLRIKFTLDEDGKVKQLHQLWNDDIQYSFNKMKE